MDSKKLVMSFDPQTIEHLGVKMYSVLPNAIAELVANAYDADAANVHINLMDDGDKKSISVTDDGCGMSFEELNEKFLKIGRKRRKNERSQTSVKQRKVTGRKGLGKLAFFGIGNTICVDTVQNGHEVVFSMSWSEILNSETSNYEPSFEEIESSKKNGTTVTLSDLKRKTAFDINGLAISLSKLFNFLDDSFQVFISLNGAKEIKVDNNLKYLNLNPQITWDIPGNLLPDVSYFEENCIAGKILATEKPLAPGMRGVTLFAHGRLVNAPEFFGVGESSHGYSYLTGFLNVDFIDEQEEDVISTDRQSLSWDLPVVEDLRTNLQNLLRALERDWREKRKFEKNKAIGEKAKININDWVSKTPAKVKSGVEKIISSLADDSEMEAEKQSAIIQNLHELLPEYTYYHYRHLHKTVQEVSSKDYQRQDFYRSFEEVMKRYVKEVQKKSGLKDTDVALMHNAFGKNKALAVAKKYKRPSGDDFNNTTIENIQEGQHYLSTGIVSGGRNPIAHEEITDLQNSGLFTENDCLDFLSLLSHLFRRLDDA